MRRRRCSTASCRSSQGTTCRPAIAGSGLRELGLPYEPEPAITRHLAAFLSRATRDEAAAGGLAVPDCRPLQRRLLHAGAGADTASSMRSQSWFGTRPMVLENERPEAAVAIGAAYYARLRAESRGGEAAVHPGRQRTRLLRRAARPRGARSAGHLRHAARHGRRHDARRSIARSTSPPTSRSRSRSTAPPSGTTRSNDDRRADGSRTRSHRHAPLVTVLRYGKRSRRVSLGGRACASSSPRPARWSCGANRASSEHRWRLAFNLRAAEADPLEVAERERRRQGRLSGRSRRPAGGARSARLRLIDRVFKARRPGSPRPPESLTADLEATLGFGKQAWPLGDASGGWRTRCSRCRPGGRAVPPTKCAG